MTPEAAYVAGGDACIEDERLERPTSEGPEDPELRIWWCRGYSAMHVTGATARLARERAAAEERLRVEQIVARGAYIERDAAHAALTAAGVDAGREEGDPPTGYSLTTRIGLLVEERDELRLVLLAEQGDPAGAPSGGWSMGGDGSWRKGGAPGTDTTYRVVSFVAPARHGRAAVRAWRVRPAGGADIGGEAPTAREAMEQADRVAEGEQG